MSSSGRPIGLAKSVRCDDRLMYVTLRDGRIASAPLTPRLLNATQRQRDKGRVRELGTALHWEEIDEDVGVNYVLGVSEDEIYDLAGFTRGMPPK
jgi:hypothetical protein